MRERNIAVGIILTLLTCGIYMFIWLWMLNNEVRNYNQKSSNSGLNIILSFITCGIYFLVWNYNLGEDIDEMTRSQGNTGLIYLLITLIGFPIVSIALAQNEVNKLCRRNMY